MAGDGGQFTLAIKNWQELFVHKWDTSLKVTEYQSHYSSYMHPSIESRIYHKYVSSSVVVLINKCKYLMIE